MSDQSEQFSSGTAEKLRVAAQNLSQTALRYAAIAARMRGSSGDIVQLHRLNDDLEAAVRELNESAFQHTGMLPLFLGPPGATEEEENDEATSYTGGFEPPSETCSYLSVVSRWDVRVRSAQQLMEAGRGAHMREHPIDTSTDACLAVPDPASALRELLGDDGRFWFSVPGIEPLNGLRVCVSTGDVLPPLTDCPDRAVDDVCAPEGDIQFSERW